MKNKKDYCLEYVLSILVKADDENDAVEIVSNKMSELKLPEGFTIGDECINIFSEDEGLKI